MVLLSVAFSAGDNKDNKDKPANKTEEKNATIADAAETSIPTESVVASSTMIYTSGVIGLMSLAAF